MAPGGRTQRDVAEVMAARLSKLTFHARRMTAADLSKPCRSAPDASHWGYLSSRPISNCPTPAATPSRVESRLPEPNGNRGWRSPVCTGPMLSARLPVQSAISYQPSPASGPLCGLPVTLPRPRGPLCGQQSVRPARRPCLLPLAREDWKGVAPTGPRGLGGSRSSHWPERTGRKSLLPLVREDWEEVAPPTGPRGLGGESLVPLAREDWEGSHSSHWSERTGREPLLPLAREDWEGATPPTGPRELGGSRSSHWSERTGRESLLARLGPSARR